MKIREFGQRVLAVIMMLCIITGIILMMCESEDWNTQKWTQLGGFGLFLIGVAPGVIVALNERRRESHG